MELFLLHLKLLFNQYVTFSTDHLFMYLALVITGLIVLFPVIFYFNMKGAFIVSLFLSIFLTLLLFYLAGLGNAFSTSNQQQTTSVVEYFLLVIVGVLFFTFLSYGIGELCKLFKGDVFSKKGLQVWVVLLGLPVISMFGKSYLTQSYEILHFISMDTTVTSHKMYPIYIDELVFTNTKNSQHVKYDDINGIGHSKKLYTYGEFYQLSLKEQYNEELNSVTSNGSVTHHKTPKIPIGTNEFSLSWYSFVDDKYYSDTFLFPMEKLDTNKRYPDLQKFIREITLHIFPGGNAYLLNHDKQQILNYTRVTERDISPQRREEFYQAYFESVEFDGSEKNLRDELNLIKQKNVLKDLLEAQAYFNWSFQHNLTNEVNKVSAVDFGYIQHNRISKGEYRGPLPRVLKISTQDFRFEIYIDGSTLIKMINENIKDRASSMVLQVNFNAAASAVNNIKLISGEDEILIGSVEVYKFDNSQD